MLDGGLQIAIHKLCVHGRFEQPLGVLSLIRANREHSSQNARANWFTGAALGVNSRPAKPGDVIIAYGIGFGDVTPAILPGIIVGQSNALVNPVTVSFGSAPATLSYAGLAGNFVGLYEFYIMVPPGLANGDYQINMAQNGAMLPQTMYLTVHN